MIWGIHVLGTLVEMGFLIAIQSLLYIDARYYFLEMKWEDIAICFAVNPIRALRRFTGTHRTQKWRPRRLTCPMTRGQTSQNQAHMDFDLPCNLQDVETSTVSYLPTVHVLTSEIHSIA